LAGGLITMPGPLEIGLFDWRTQFCDESLHSKHLIHQKNARCSVYTAILQLPSNKFEVESTMTQSYTFIDPGGNQAQYTVYDADHRNQYHWSTDHGDSGVDLSYGQAQNRARTALKASMAARRRSDPGRR
jgi:hypothetical protein